MNRYLLLVFSFLLAFSIHAQQAKYLIGAVPEVNGKVVFEKSIKVKNPITEDNLFALMDKWAKENYKSESNLDSRVLLSDPSKRTIACSGEKYLVFKRSALSLDRAKMTYQLILKIENQSCDVTVRSLKFEYSDRKDAYSAEELITDKMALNKKGDKLNRYYDKFRIHALDSVNSIFNSIDVYLNGVSTTGAAVQQVAVSQPEPKDPVGDIEIPILVSQAASQSLSSTYATSSMSGYKQVPADKIPGNYIKLLNDWTLITSGKEGAMNVMTASWGGLGMLWGKPVVFCFLNPTRYSVKTMDSGDTYTISFYTEAYRDNLKYCGSVSGSTTDKIKGSGLTAIKTPSGATAFSEAWMILECKKLVSQQLSPDAVTAESLPADWTKSGYHKMYIGEILNVWIK